MSFAEQPRKRVVIDGHVPAEEIRNVFTEALRRLREDNYAGGDRRPPLQEMETFLDDLKMELFSRAQRNAEAIYSSNPTLRKERPEPPAMTQVDSRDEYAAHKKRILDQIGRS